MPEIKLTQPKVSKEDKIVRLKNIADIFTSVTGIKFEYIGTDEELNKLKSKKSN